MAERVDYQGKGLGLVDDKGRVAIPNTLRAMLAKNAPREDGKDGGTVIIAPHPEHRCLIAYDPGFVPYWKAKLEALDAAQFEKSGRVDYNILDRAGGAEPLPFDQQPLEAQATIDACAAAFDATGDRRWFDEAKRAYDWYLGANDLDLPLASLGDGGCFDGLMPSGLNRNQGAESILALQMASCAISGLSKRVEKVAGTGVHERSA